MTVVHIQAGKVIAVFRDVETVADARAKYPHLKGKRLEVASHPPGTLFANGAFTIPAPTVKPPEIERAEIRAIRALADAADPAVKATVIAILGVE